MSSTGQDSPYVGLVPYSERDAERFCGRDAETEALVSLTLGSRCIIVHGPSGVGKSSLLRAGVSATLHKIADAQQEAFAKPDFVVAYCSDWKDPDPFTAVHAAITAAWENPGLPDRSLRECVAAGVQQNATDLVLILDQFEEFFLYHPDAIPQPETAARGWLRQIASLMAVTAAGTNGRATLLPVHLVIALREEALAKLDGLQRLVPALFDNVYRVAPLTTAQARDAVTDPLHWWNDHHPGEPPVTATDAFARQVADQVRHGHVDFDQLSKARQSTTHAGGALDAVEAPFLQLVLETVWHESRLRWTADPALPRQLDAAVLDELGGAPAIVNNHLKRTLEDSRDDSGKPLFPPAELELIARLSLHLVTIDLAKIAHSSASLAEFVERPESEIAGILTKLARLRILRAIPVPGQPGQERYEIAHDMLGKAIVNWRPDYLKQVEMARQEKETNERYIRRYLQAAAVGLVVLSAFLFYAIRSGQRAKEAANIAEEQRKEAESEREEANRQKESAEAEKEAANTLTQQLRLQSREEILRREEQEKRLHEVTSQIDNFLERHPSYRNEFSAVTASIQQAVEELRNPLISTLSADGPIRAARYSPDGRYIAIGSENKELILWSRNGGSPLSRTEASTSVGGVSSLAFSPTAGFLLTGSAGSSIRLFDPRREKLGNGQTVGAQNSVNFIGFSPDGRFSVSFDDDRLAELRDWSLYPKLTPQKPAATWKHGGAITHADFSHDGNFVVTSCDDGGVRVFSTSRGMDLLQLSSKGASRNPLDVKAPTRKFRFSPSNPRLVVGGAGNSKLVWFDLSGDTDPVYQDYTKSEGDRGPFIHESRGAVWDVAFSPDGKHLASIGTDGLCLIWDTRTAKTLASVPTRLGGRIFDVEWSKSNLLALAGENGWIELWNMDSPDIPYRVFDTHAHKCPVWSLQFDPLGEQLLTHGRDIRPIRTSIPIATGRAAEWSPPSDFPADDFTAAIWDIGIILTNSSRSR